MEAVLLSSNFSSKLNIAVGIPLSSEEQKSSSTSFVILLNISQPANITLSNHSIKLVYHPITNEHRQRGGILEVHRNFKKQINSFCGFLCPSGNVHQIEFKNKGLLYKPELSVLF
jgi:hypothetical protein